MVFLKTVEIKVSQDIFQVIDPSGPCFNDSSIIQSSNRKNNYRDLINLEESISIYLSWIGFLLVSNYRRV